MFEQNKTLSVQNAQAELQHLTSSLLSLSLQTLSFSKNILCQDLFQRLKVKYQELVVKEHQIYAYFEQFVYLILNEISIIQQKQTLNIFKEDYEVLEKSVQKAQAQIRSHVQKQQQIQFYVQEIQQKNQQLQQNIQIEISKYSKLYQTLRQMDEERQNLIKKINSLQEKSQIFCGLNLQADKKGSLLLKSNIKSKSFLQKSNQKKNKPKNNPVSVYVQGSLYVNLPKKSSFDNQNVNRADKKQYDTIQQLTKTVNMKQPVNPYYERRVNRKLSRNKTEIKDDYKNGRLRSNSVLN